MADLDRTHDDDDECGYRLSNGSVLRRGCRVRVPSSVAWDIPNEDRKRLGLYLDEGAYSPASEVVVWPLEVPHA